jgi:hypothetical protein
LLDGFEEGEVRGPVRVVLYAHDFVLARAHAVEVYRPDPAPVSTSSVSHAHFARVVPAALTDADLGEGEFADGLALVQVLVYGAA